jgi:ADP-heptose:LPS heptosyltransferase
MLKLFNYDWKIVTVREPVMFHRTEDEVWLLNPNRRYILNAQTLEGIADYVETTSDLEGGELYHPLTAGCNISQAKIVIERMRERGIGDLLFLTGPLAFLNHVTGRNIEIDLYALSDRGGVITQNPDVHNKVVLCGPLEYDHLRHYNYHWFIKTVTECDEEPDQLNVYDALFKQIGFDPENIEPEWKRPRAYVGEQDYKHLDQLFRIIWEQRKIDLRRVGYYVVAPFAVANVRSLDYPKWLEIIKTLGQRRPVIVVGSTRQKLPDSEMAAGDFMAQVAGMGGGVINAVDGTPLRVLMALISRAVALLCLDSGPLYIAQALRTPAISFWGPHHPGVRIGYDPDYMDLALWNESACVHAPCFTYISLPENKCPDGRAQRVCACLKAVTVDQVLAKIDKVEAKNVQLATFPAK